MLIAHKDHKKTMHVYSVTATTHVIVYLMPDNLARGHLILLYVIVFDAGQSSQGTFDPTVELYVNTPGGVLGIYIGGGVPWHTKKGGS